MSEPPGPDRSHDQTVPRTGNRSGDRDRNAAGRPQNSRQRDDLGRPLPRGATGVRPFDETRVRSGSETLAEAADLLSAGLPFQAHEVLELRWKRCPDPERPLWQALAQLAVGVTHARRGNLTGARTLLSRAGSGLADYRGPVPSDLDPTAVQTWIAGALETLEHTDPASWFRNENPPLT